MCKKVAVTAGGEVLRAPDEEIEEAIKEHAKVPPEIARLPAEAYVKVVRRMRAEIEREEQEEEKEGEEDEEKGEEEGGGEASHKGKRRRVEVQT